MPTSDMSRMYIAYIRSTLVDPAGTTAPSEWRGRRSTLAKMSLESQKTPTTLALHDCRSSDPNHNDETCMCSSYTLPMLLHWSMLAQ